MIRNVISHNKYLQIKATNHKTTRRLKFTPEGGTCVKHKYTCKAIFVIRVTPLLIGGTHLLRV